MDEEMEIMEALLVEEPSFTDDVDSEYEFDACQFFDFVRGETESEAQEADSWFGYADEYPPSPFILKLKMMKAAKAAKAAKANQMKAHKTSSKKKEADKKFSTSSASVSDGDIDHETPSKESKIKGVKHHNHIPQDNSKTKSKSTVYTPKQSGSSFMKPTASHLAKQNKERDTHSGGYGRLQKPLVSPGEKLQSPSRCQNQATKRQKLEIGYLRKVAQLKHRASFLHKIVKKAAQMEGSSNYRCKTTIPQKPSLVFEERAQSRRSHNKPEPIQQPKANTYDAIKARQLNKKNLDSPKFPQGKKSMTQCQVLNKQNSAPPMSEDRLLKGQNYRNKDYCKSPNNLKSCNSEKVHPIRDGGFMLNANQNSHLPPIELFKKLSLKPESKENMGGSFHEFRRCGGRPNQCGTNRRFTQVKT